VIAIDSSVWINVWPGVQTPASLRLTENASTARIVTLDLVLFELLQDDRDYGLIAPHLGLRLA
jgi:hypothetical protein